MAWRRWNPNPQGLMVGDCTVRAICALTGQDWNRVHRDLCDLSRDMADMPSADRVWWSMVEANGLSRQRLLDRCPDCYTVADFAADHPRGIYILCPHEHAVFVADGDYWDSWDSGGTIPTHYFGRR